jgi:hypothetical protein
LGAIIRWGKRAEGVLSSKSLLVISGLISKYTGIFFGETLEEMEPSNKERLENYILHRFRQIFALPSGSGYPHAELEKLLKEERRRNAASLEKIVEGIISEFKSYVDAEEREKERRRKGIKPLLTEYVT